jgi:hypothetical protein
MATKDLRTQSPTSLPPSSAATSMPYVGMGNQQLAAAAALPELETCTADNQSQEQKSAQSLGKLGVDTAKTLVGEKATERFAGEGAKKALDLLKTAGSKTATADLKTIGGRFAVGKQALGASAGIGALVGGAMSGAESMWENAERADRDDFDATDASADVIMDSVGGAIQGGAAGIGATIGTIICPGLGTVIGGAAGIGAEYLWSKLMKESGGDKYTREMLSKGMDAVGAEDAMKWGWGKLGGARKYADGWFGMGDSCAPQPVTDRAPNLETCDVPDLGTCEVPDLGTCEVPDLGTCEVPDLGTCEVPDLGTCEVPDFGTCEVPDLRTCEVPDLGTCEVPDLRTCEVPDLGTCEVPDLRTPEIPDLRTCAAPPRNRPAPKTAARLAPSFRPRRRAAPPAVASPSATIAAPPTMNMTPSAPAQANTPTVARLPPSFDAELPGLAPNLPLVLPHGVLPPPARVPDPAPAQVPAGAARAMKALNAARNQPV